MMKSLQTKTRNPGSVLGKVPLASRWLLLLLLAAPLASLAGTLREVSYSALPGHGVQITLTADGPVMQPESFSTQNPARIALDLYGLKNGLERPSQAVGIAMVRSIDAVESGDRTRMVVNLIESVPYYVEVRGNQILVTVNAQPPAGRVASVPARQAVAQQPAARSPIAVPPRPVSTQAQPTAAVAAAQPMAARPAAMPSGPAITDIDFRRGDDGEGRIVFTLNDPSIVVDLQEEVGQVVMDFIGAKIPDKLIRRFDVTDFDTPVKSFEVTKEAKKTHIDVASRKEFEYLAYQTDNVFTVEFRPLTKEQKEELKKKQIGYTGERLSLNFQDIEVRSVLQLLGDFTGLNMVVSDTVAGNITLRLQNVPWDQALDIILKTKGLDKRQNDNVILIAPADEIAAQEKKELEALKDKQELAPLRSEFIQVQYAKAKDIAALLKSSDNQLLTPERGNVSSDDRTNTLLVQDTSAKLEEIARLVRRLDIPVRQVLIESRVVIASDNFTKDLGIRLGFSRSNHIDGGSTDVMVGGGLSGGLDGTTDINKGVFSQNYEGVPFQTGVDVDGADGLMVNLPAAVSTGGIMNVLVSKIGSYLLQLELSAMQREGQGEIVSSPRVVTSDKNQATISQGMEVPYQSMDADGNPTTSWRDATLKLDVTPSITPEDRVIMDLEITKNAANFGNTVNGTPPIDKRAVETTVLVDNGETVVLGGVFEKSIAQSTDKIPVLGDLPYVGRLFRHDLKTEDNQELLIFVTPKILKDTLGMR